MAFVFKKPYAAVGVTFVLRGKEILVNEEFSPVCDVSLTPDFADSISGHAAVRTDAGYTPDSGHRFIPVREYFTKHNEKENAAAARMLGYSNWLKDTKFCSACGKRLVPHDRENALVCPDCGKVFYPRISPCIITVIEKGDEILLLRHVQRNQELWCCLAGFVESGESLEQALRREVREETGLEISNLRYFGSQSWPFPDQLMIAYLADYESGELKIQEDEIAQAAWFRRDSLPPHPAEGSISWRLIHCHK